MGRSTVTVLVLGANGMLGSAVIRLFAASEGFDAWGSVRSTSPEIRLPPKLRDRLLFGVDVESADAIAGAIAAARPNVVINCVGLVKQLAAAKDPLLAIPINSIFPHRLARMCEIAGARLVHISTDCVFSGTKGMYREIDSADARDLYGLTKYLGEVDYPRAVTLRTSIIGPGITSAHGLIGWFLSQTGSVQGFTRAIFSGLPTVELARVIRDYVLPRPELRGVHHVSSAPISKYDLLRLVAKAYHSPTEIVPSDELVIDRSLDSSEFRAATGYEPPPWPELVRRMREFG